MNKCYFGNFQDFCKYGLLRELAEFLKERGNELHFCQMTTPERKGTGGKGNYDYLDSPGRYRWLGEELFDDLKEWCNKLQAGNGGDEWLRVSENLLPDVRHYNEEVPGDEAGRKTYFQGMLRQFGSKNLVFFNPDYGLEFASRLIREGDSRRYIRAEEIRQCIDGGNSVMFYQEMLAPEKQGAAQNLWRDVLHNLRGAAVYNRVLFFASRAPSYTEEKITAESGFFLIVHKDHKTVLENFTAQFLESDWCKQPKGGGGAAPLFNITRRIGVFVDTDNFHAPHIKYVLGKIESQIPMGEIRYKVAFGKSDVIERVEEMKQKGEIDIETRRVSREHKDEADLAVSFDVARAILLSQIDIAVVLSKDGGFKATAKQAKAMGAIYIGVGFGDDAPQEYRSECDMFFQVDRTPQGNYAMNLRKKAPRHSRESGNPGATR